MKSLFEDVNIVAKRIKDVNEFAWTKFEQPRRRMESKINDNLGWKNEEIIQNEVNIHRYELVYEAPHFVYRLLGWTDQCDEDYYWIVGSIVYGIGNKIQLCSCVGGFIWLKNQLSFWDYSYSDYIYELNYPVVEMVEEAKNTYKIL